ncbi:MAG TPA: hypothetical protein VNK96_10040 [Fimbriimonadales bacterium]|nr:hypothetical protein [Fimbriimonadales bacterium]
MENPLENLEKYIREEIPIDERKFDERLLSRLAEQNERAKKVMLVSIITVSLVLTLFIITVWPRSSEEAVMISAGGGIWKGLLRDLPETNTPAVVLVSEKGRVTGAGIYRHQMPLRIHPIKRSDERKEAELWSMAIDGKLKFEAAREEIIQRTSLGAALILADGPGSPFISDFVTDERRVTWAEGANELAEELRKLGFEYVEVRFKAPEGIAELNKFDLVIITAYNRTTNPALGDMLREYVRDGGGVVLTEGVPSIMCTQYGPNEDVVTRDKQGISNERNLSRIADWFGGIYYENTEGGPVRITVNKPFDEPILLNITLGLKGSAAVRLPEKNSSALPIAIWEKNRSCFAFANRFGYGRVYYQATASDFHYTRSQNEVLRKLFLGGCLWAAGNWEDVSQ